MRVLRARVPGALLALLAVLGVGLLGLLPARSAAAAEPEALVTITLTSLSPALPTRDGTITVTGRVTNVSDAPVSNLQAILWRSSDPLTTPEAMDRALDSAADDPIGRRLYSRDYQNIPSEDDRTLAPGASTTFRLRTEVANLDLPRADGVYLFGVHVRGRTVDDPQRDQTLGRARTFLPLLSEEPAGRLQMTSLVVLSSRPSLLRRGVLVDDHLTAEVQPGGRLDELLDAADSPGTSFAVDPALIDALTTMKDGYSVQNGDGASTTGRGRSAAAGWLARFASVEATRDGFRLLYGSPDVAALVHGRQTDVLTDAVEAGRRVSGTASLPLLVLPGGGKADAETVQAAERLHPAAIVLSDASVVADRPLLAAPEGTAGEAAPIVRYSSTTSGGGGPGPDPRTTAVQLRQRALADSWIQASTASSSAQGRVRLITSTKQVQDDDPGIQAPWLTPSTLSALLDGPPASWDATFEYPDAALAAELTTGQLRSLRTFARSHDTYAELLADPEEAQQSGQAAVAAAASTSWRADDRQRRLLLIPQQSALDAVLVSGLEISSNHKVSTVAQQGVKFPITVKNLLPVDADDDDVNVVNLNLVFVSDNRQRLTIETIPFKKLGPKQSLTENAVVTARANGTVPVRAQLQTLSGTPVGRPLTIDVRVTQNGTTGWAIAGAAMVVFLGGTALRIRRVSRARTASAGGTDAAAAGPPSALTSAPPTDPDALEPGPTTDPHPDDRDRLDA